MAKIAEKKVNRDIALREDSMGILRAQVVHLDGERRTLVKEVEDLRKMNETLLAERAGLDLEAKQLKEDKITTDRRVADWKKV